MKRLGFAGSGSLVVAPVVPRPMPLRRVARTTIPTLGHYIRAGLLGLALAVFLSLVLFLPSVVLYPQIIVGDVAPSTMVAPRMLRFEDRLRTAQLRQQAASQVFTQFRSDPAAQQQANTMAARVLSAAIMLRGTRLGGNADSHAGELSSIAPGAVPIDLSRLLLDLSPSDLAAVRDAVLAALRLSSHQVVYSTELPVLQTAPPFPLSLPGGQVRAIATMLYDIFLRANRIPDPVLTVRVQAQAAARVQPVYDAYRSGQVILRNGDVVDAQTLAALHAANLTGPNASWSRLLADFLISLLVAALLHGYLISIRSPILVRQRRLLLLDVLFLCTMLAAAFVLQGSVLQLHGPLPFVFPAAAMSMLITVLLNGELGMVAMAVWSILAGWYLGGSLEIATYYLVTGLSSALLVRRVRRSSEFFAAGLAGSGAGLIAVLAFRILDHGYTWLGLGTYAAGAILSGGLAAALTLGSFSVLGRLFGVTTALHLLELSHPNHPLLRRLMQEAPGTYHHSMMIGTIAERAAGQIGADPLLMRVIAYFHDIGKLVKPTNFAENQAGISNIHDELDPLESVRLIMQHIYEGVRLARHYHLPEVLEDGIWQHHGTNLVSFFYQQAVALYGEDNVNVDDYRYPGPRPQSREMAILMLADGVEAAVRASPGIDGDQIRAIIHRLAQERLRDGQLDECNLTLRDLAIIEESFAIVLQGISHPRVQYPAPLPVAGSG